MIVFTRLCVHMGELVSAYDAVLHHMRWEWVTVGGYGGHERDGMMLMPLLHPRLLSSSSRICPCLFLIGLPF